MNIFYKKLCNQTKIFTQVQSKIILEKSFLRFGKMQSIQQVPNLKNGQEKPRPFYPFNIINSSHLTPDNSDFFKFDLNIAILTKYGRYIYIRHGNQQKCSSFFATLCTIVNKLELSFSTEGQSTKLKKIRQGKLTFYVLKRQNYQYICWTKIKWNEINIYEMVEFLHYQLKSCLTQKVNDIIEQNPSYDPTSNISKNSNVYKLFTYAILNGLYTLPVLFKSVPVLKMKNSLRQELLSQFKALKEEEEQQGILISILMTMSGVVSIWKQKEIDIDLRDYLLLFNLLQTSSSLNKSENWFPICLPGIDEQQLLFCYLNYLGQDLIHILISDQSDKFSQLSAISKMYNQKISTNPLLTMTMENNLTINYHENSLIDYKNYFKHFIIVNLNQRQILQSQANYFGFNKNKDYLDYLFLYSQLYHHYLITAHHRKEKLHTQHANTFLSGYYEDGQFLVMFVMPFILDLEECKNTISSILKFIKEEKDQLFFSMPK